MVETWLLTQEVRASQVQIGKPQKKKNLGTIRYGMSDRGCDKDGELKSDGCRGVRHGYVDDGCGR